MGSSPIIRTKKQGTTLWCLVSLYDADLNPPKKGDPAKPQALWGGGAPAKRQADFAQRNPPTAQRGATKAPSSAPSKNRLIKPKSSGYFYASTTLCTTLLFLHHKAALSANGGRSIFLHKKAAERAALPTAEQAVERAALRPPHRRALSAWWRAAFRPKRTPPPMSRR